MRARRFETHGDRPQHRMMPPWPRLAGRWRARAFWLVWLPILLWPGSGDAREPVRDAGQARGAAAHSQSIADQFSRALGIAEHVVVSIVPQNPLLVSVARMPGQPGSFRLAIEEAFLGTLDEEELRAVIAHELGHVWIFTNHPYLHTEQLANRIAMRLVSRDSLARVYPKVWARTGEQGDLVRFLGE